jgi:hypothetical protein
MINREKFLAYLVVGAVIAGFILAIIALQHDQQLALAETTDLKAFLPLMGKKFCSSGPGSVTGKVVNAATTNPIVGASVCFGASCGTTDATGHYTVNGVPSGLQVGVASSVGYYPVESVVTVKGCQTVTLNFALYSYFSGDRQLRAVLTWDPTTIWQCNPYPCVPPEQNWPNDLDIHFWILDPLNPTNSQHINSGDPRDRGRCDQFPSSLIEADAIFGFGPETLNVCAYEDAIYHYAVLNVNQYYPGDVPLITQVQAHVNVYVASGLDRELEPPSTGEGDLWYVFMMNGVTGVITETNCITYLPGTDLEAPHCP